MAIFVVLLAVCCRSRCGGRHSLARLRDRSHRQCVAANGEQKVLQDMLLPPPKLPPRIQRQPQSLGMLADAYADALVFKIPSLVPRLTPRD